MKAKMHIRVGKKAICKNEKSFESWIILLTPTSVVLVTSSLWLKEMINYY